MIELSDGILTRYGIVITSDRLIISRPAIVEIWKANIEGTRDNSETVDILIKKGGYIQLHKDYTRLEIILL